MQNKFKKDSGRDKRTIADMKDNVNQNVIRYFNLIECESLVKILGNLKDSFVSFYTLNMITSSNRSVVLYPPP